MAERFKASVLKTEVDNYRGFESLFLRYLLRINGSSHTG